MTILSLSAFQKQLWVEWKLNPKSIAYNINFCYRFTGFLDVKKLTESISEVYSKNGLLGLRLIEEDGVPYQSFVDPLPLEWEYVDYSDVSGKDEKFLEFYRQYSRPFQFGNEPPFRLFIIKFSEHEHIFCLTFHHIILDAISGRLLIKDIEEQYKNTINEQTSFYIKNNVTLTAQNKENIAYWGMRLQGYNPYIQLLERNKSVSRFAGRRMYFELDEYLTENIVGFSSKNKSTLFITIAAIVNVLLYRFSGQEDICVGYSVNIRDEKSKNALGFFINTIPLRTILNPEMCIKDVIKTIRNNRSEDKRYQKIQAPSILNHLRSTTGSEIDSLFNIFINQSLSFTTNFSLPGIHSEHIHLEYNDPQYDLLISFDLIGKKLCFEFEYNLRKYDPIFMNALKESLGCLCKAVIDLPDEPIAALPITSVLQQKLILNSSKGEQLEIAESLWTPDHFKKIVKTYPDKKAIHFNTDSLSYKEFEERVTVLARYILYNFPDSKVIGICLNRSLELVITAHAIQLAGKAYLPLDPSYPFDRLEYMVNHSQLQLVITHENLNHIWNNFSCNVLKINSLNWKDNKLSPFSFQGDGNDIAYVIYTSGSTGKPKGIAVPHCGLVNRIKWMQFTYPLTPLDKVLQKTPYSFDVSVWEIFWPTMVGASMVVAPPDIHKDPIILSEFIDQHQITVIHFVPSMLQAFLEFHQPEKNQSLRYVFCSGEALSFSQIENFYKHFPNAVLHNLYGPTEASIDVTFWDTRNKTESMTPPIGKPIHNMQCLILDNQKKILPIGVSGELHLSGIGLCKEYINDPEITHKAFIKNPYNLNDHPLYKKIYCTGDLARYLPNGEIEYLGRLDNQVKIRGLRIELEEIQNILISHFAIQNAVVVAKDQRLIAYIQLKEISDSLSIEALSRFLAEILPEYMVPHRFVFLSQLPLTPSGKLNRKELPDPNSIELHSIATVDKASLEQCALINPETQSPKALFRKIWSEALQLPEEKISDNISFFKLGGDSILMLQVIAKAHKKGITIKPTQFFPCPTINDLVKDFVIPQSEKNSHNSPFEGEFILSPIQQWFFDNYESTRNHFNQYYLLDIRPGIKTDLVKESINQLIKRHETLRLRFHNKNVYWTQSYQPSDLSNEFFNFKCIQSPLTYEKGISKYIQLALKNTNIENGPLLVAYILEFSDKILFLISCHHLVVDALSWPIIINDINEIYAALEQNQSFSQKNNSITYKDWIHSQENYVKVLQFSQEVSFWKNQLPLLDETKDLESKTFSKGVQIKEYQLPIIRPEISLQDIQNSLITGLTYAFKQILNKKEVILERESHGREDILDTNPAGALGWFTTKYIVKYFLNNPTLEKHLEYIKKINEDIPNNGIGFSILKYLGILNVTRLFNYTPSISFNFLGKQPILYDLTPNSLIQGYIEPLKLVKKPSKDMPYDIDLNAWIENNTIKIIIEYKNYDNIL